ncbi:MAG: hypothetical protein GXO79_04465 [Chlorobi bacterium]|nr:hypothetical protein [Chlorobiota bacterium]
MLKIIKLAILFFLIISQSFAGVWTRQKGSGYSQLSFTTKSYQNRYIGGYSDTEIFRMRRAVTQTGFFFYGEYGISDKLTLITNIPFYSLNTSNVINTDPANPYSDTLAAGSLTGLGNVNVSLRYPVKTDGLLISLQLSTEINSSVYDDFTGLRTGFDAWTFTPSILLGKGFSNQYFSFETGAFIRTNGYNQGIIAHAEYGWTPNNKTYLIGVTNGVFKLTNGTYNDKNSKHTATFIDNQGYIAIGAKLFQKISSHFSLNITYFTGFAVINEGDNPGGLYFGLAYEW